MAEEQNNTAEKIWERVVAIYRASLTDSTEISKMERYFPSFVSMKIEDSEFRIGVPEELQVSWYTDIFSVSLNTALQIIKPKLSIKFIVDKTSKRTLPQEIKQVSSMVPLAQNQVVESTPENQQVHPMVSTLPLNEAYTFENFVEGPSNSFAYAAASAVAKGPGKTTYNPLFIWGGTGLGKTHLMEAIGHRILQQNANSAVCYITSETFFNEYINAMSNQSLPTFRDRYRKVDVLLIDDIQFIANKKQFQEEFFNTFNALVSSGKQIVMTSDIAPRNMHDLEERLTSRFSAGMVVEIESPSYETRLAILQSKVQSSQGHISEDILQYIAQNICSHVRALEGALGRLIAYCEINPSQPLTLEKTRYLLKDSIEEEQTIKELTIAEIIQNVAEFYNVKIEDIKSPERTATLVTARQMAMFLARKLTTHSLQEIGKAFGKNHTTVLYGASMIKKHLDVDIELKQAVEEITSRLGRKISDVIKSGMLK